MIIAIASGKGGTGKTTLATALARTLGEKAQLIDCDVEEPNAHLFLRPVVERTFEVTQPVPQIDLTRCTYCGECSRFCRFRAIAVLGDQTLVFPELCHGCGGCTRLCPEKAIQEVGRPIGVVEQGRADGIEVVTGKLKIGEPMAIPIIREVRSLCRDDRTVILDAPPGTACPMVATVRGADYCILVTEPTPFGVHDLGLAEEVVQLLGVPHGVVVNRSDLGGDGVQALCRERSIPILLEIPEDRELAEGYAQGKTIVDVRPDLRDGFLSLLEQVCQLSRGIPAPNRVGGDAPVSSPDPTIRAFPPTRTPGPGSTPAPEARAPDPAGQDPVRSRVRSEGS